MDKPAEPALHAYNQPGHRWKRDILGDVFAFVTDAATIALIVGLAVRLFS